MSVESVPSFPEVFAARAAQTPQHTAIHLVGFNGGEVRARPLTFFELQQRVQKAAWLLSERGVRAQDRVILSIADAGVFFAFLVGAQCLGAIPVPLPSVAELPLQAYRTRIHSVVQDANPVAIVLDAAGVLEVVDEQMRTQMQVIDATQLDRTTPQPVADFSWARGPEEIAFLQYTSGSTGRPKGVVVLHSNLVANLSAMIEGLSLGPEDRIYSWLPLFHDMGLVAGLLMGPFAGMASYVTPPKNFLARPDSWLRAISQLRITFSPAPNFAYSMLARRVPDSALRGLDLSSWRLACDGAEPVDASTARAFMRRFAPFGFRAESFRPVYGLAEGTLACAVPRAGSLARFDSIDRLQLAESGTAAPASADEPTSVSFAGVGPPVPGHDIRICDPGDDKPLPPRRIGEIVVSGPSVTPYYFHEMLAGESPRAALRTGDLGYMVDGELYVVDRLKDVLIVAGRKYSPSDLENVVAGIPGVKRGAVAAFTARGEGTDELIVALAPDARAGAQPAALTREASAAVYRHFGLTPANVVLIRAGDLPKTSSGKLQRAVCRSLYENGAWSPPQKSSVA